MSSSLQSSAKAASMPLAILAVLIGCECRADGGGTATIKVVRPNQFTGSGCTVYLKVNGRDCGKVEGYNSGKHTDNIKEIKFTPRKGQKTVLEAKLSTLFVSFTKTSEFDIEPGNSYVVELTCSRTFTGDIAMSTTIQKEANAISNGIVSSIVLDKKLKSVVLKESPPIKLARGTEKVVTDTVRVQHSVSIASSWKVEAQLKAAADIVWASASLDIKAKIEKSTNTTFATETERTRSVTLKGDASSGKTKVVWVEYYRTGKAKVILNGKEVEVPFEFKEDFDLLTEDAE